MLFIPTAASCGVLRVKIKGLAELEHRTEDQQSLLLQPAAKKREVNNFPSQLL
jgi:hypothetical protein